MTTFRALCIAAVLVAASLVPSTAVAQTIPQKASGFHLLHRPGAYGFFQTNQAVCNVSSDGVFCSEICCDVANAGWWPRASPQDRYFFAAGPEVAGIIGPDGGPWAGDTTGAFFFDMKGTTVHGQAVTQVYNAISPDSLQWPDAARVPAGSPLIHSSLHGRASASEGDVWWLSSETNPGLVAGRPHPLGLVMEVRGLAWNGPGSNEDIVYFLITLHNVTSLDPAAYASTPAALRPYLLAEAQKFHDLTEQDGVTIPSAGYTLEQLYFGLAADMDVGSASRNFSSVNVPMSLGFAWDATFGLDVMNYWTFDPRYFSPPFFTGPGLAGIKFLSRTPSDGSQPGLSVFETLSGNRPVPANTTDLFRSLGQHDILGPANGPPCNFNPGTTRICSIQGSTPTDTRLQQSFGPFPSLPPGGSATVAVAYLFAAPLGIGSTATCPACEIAPGTPAIIAGLGDPSIVAGGVNSIDSIAGFLGASDASGDGVLQEDEFVTAPRSLYNKAQVAQAVFDHQFLLPSAPAAPDFFLVPGDGRVTVLWRPSPTEQTGDPYFAIAHDAQVLNSAGALVNNPLYDPNYRQFDVEGYRIYRGRTDDPGGLAEIAQFDYAGTVISDYAGQVNLNPFCAPELGITAQCGTAFDPIAPGAARTAHVDVPLVGEVTQVRLGDRIAIANGTALSLRTDTVRSPAGQALGDVGVPFAFEDQGVRNNFRYFYSVTAFDVNSWQSGPSTFESPRILKAVVPVRPASNYRNSAGGPTVAIVGRGIVQGDTTLPQLDPATGRFSKKMPASNGADLALAVFVKELVAGPVNISVHLDSLDLGDAYGADFCLTPVPARYYITVATPSDTTPVTALIAQNCQQDASGLTLPLDAVAVDPGLAARYGGVGSYAFPARLNLPLAGNYYTNAFGRGCVNGAVGFSGAAGCEYNGARWFDGPSPGNNETQDHPNACAVRVFSTPIVTCFANAGALNGVANVFEAKSYVTTPNVWRAVEGVLGGAVRGADYNVYWGAAGKVDSVIDVSTNVVVPFEASRARGSWGILNAAGTATFGPGVNYDERAELSISDISCVEPFKSAASVQLLIPCGTASYSFSQTAVPGPLVLFTGAVDSNRTMAARPNPGFLMYLAGHVFGFELAPGATVPSAGTVWSMRDYIGAIRGGGSNCPNCLAGDEGPYNFTSYSYLAPRTFAAVGAELRLSYDVVNRVDPPTRTDLALVHTVPDPYYLRNDFEADAGHQVIKFVNLPNDAIIRIYSSSGVLVTLLEHHSTTFGGAEDWDVRNRTGRRVASGVYFYHIEAGNARRVGRLTIVNDH